MVELAREEVTAVQEEMKGMEEKLRLLLLPKDPLDDKNIMLEVGDFIDCMWAHLSCSTKGHQNRNLLLLLP